MDRQKISDFNEKSNKLWRYFNDITNFRKLEAVISWKNREIKIKNQDHNFLPPYFISLLVVRGFEFQSQFNPMSQINYAPKIAAREGARGE